MGDWFEDRVSGRVARLWRRVQVVLRWRTHQEELREEMAQHAALRAAALESRGVSTDDARASANRSMGDATVAREDAHRVWVAGVVEDTRQDIGFAVRTMRRQPLFTAVAVLGLAGGLGFGAAAFAGFNALALRGWDVREPDRMVALFATSVGVPGNRRDSGFSLDQLAMFSERATTLGGVFTYERIRPDGTGSITASPVSAGYFRTLGVPMALGRSFTPEEDRIGAPDAVMVLSHHWWARMHDSSAAVLGSTVRVRGIPFTVIGVAARGFAGTDLNHVDAWIPMAAWKLVRPGDRMVRTALAQSDVCCVHGVARLADGVTREDAARELTALMAQSRRPGIDTLERTVRVNPFTVMGSAGPDVSGEVTPIFALIFGGVGVVLLLACANVANLLLARAAARERELRIRVAIGASRMRVVRQLMVESLVLASLAAVPAVLIARWLPAWVMSVFTVGQGVNLRFTPDWRILAVTAGLAVASCVLFGLAPALHATRPTQVARHRVPLRSVFLSAQVTFCLILLVAAGQFVRLADAERGGGDLGFAPQGITEITLSTAADVSEAERSARLRIEVPEILARTGMRAAFADFQPFFGATAELRAGSREPERVASVQVSRDYFETMGHTFVAGRTVTDGAGGAMEIVVNAALAERLGGVASAIGGTVTIDSVPRTIVGVVRDARDAFTPREVRPAAYGALSWTTPPRLLVRAGDAEVQRLVRALRDSDPALGVAVQRYTWHIENYLSGWAGTAAMAGALAVLALVLASVGILGVFAFWVRQRQREIGVRMAFGATKPRIVLMLASATGRAMGWGVALGLAGSAGVGVLLRSQVRGLEAFDPVAYAIALTVLLAAAMLATLWPAWRATRVDPMEALRAE